MLQIMGFPVGSRELFTGDMLTWKYMCNYFNMKKEESGLCMWCDF